MLPLLCVIVLFASDPRSLLCHHHIAVAVLQLLSPCFLDSIRLHQLSSSPFRLVLGVDPLPSVEPNFFLFFAISFLLRTFEHSTCKQSMPRRPPPSPLRLVQGPLPPRGRSKFTMPSMPRPIFHPETVVTKRPVTRQRVHSNRAVTAVGTGELGWRAAEESPSPCAVGRAHVHVRSNVSPVDVGRVVMRPRAATCRG